jgi:Reverse transcriptase (RNA-dependent DNA polymerase)
MTSKPKSTRVKAPAFPSVTGRTASMERTKHMTSKAQSSSGDGFASMTVHPYTQKSRTSNPRKVDMRTGLNVATWNVLTLNRTGYVAALVRSLAQRNISLAGITEARLTGNESTMVEGATLLHSGGQYHVNGVALVIRPPLTDNLMKWSAISDRILTARFSHRHGHLSVLVAYAPTEDSADADKDCFYNQLDSFVSSVPPHDMLLILGDLNAVTGKSRVGYESVVGGFGSGVVNENSLRLLTFCASNGLAVVGSFFQRRDNYRWTWYSNDGRTRKEIDHIITRQRDRSLFKSCRVYRGSEPPASSDHRLLIGCLQIKLPFSTAPSNKSMRVDVERLRTDLNLAHTYAVDIQNRFSVLASENDEDIESAWQTMCGAITDSASAVIGSKQRPKQPWMSDNTFGILQQKALARDAGLVAERRRLQGIFNAKAKLDREVYYNKLADDAQAGLTQNNLRPAYRAIKCLAGKNKCPELPPVLKSDGSPCSSTEEIQNRWKEHFEAALNFPPADPCSKLVDLASNASEDPDISTDPPSLEEVRCAIGKLKNGRAAGLDGISPELLKAAIEPMSQGLHALFLKIWKKGKVPTDWKDGLIVPLYKGKGPRSECGSYRPISLLSIPGKVFAHFLLGRMKPLLEKHRRPEQSGFTAGRSTSDAILALRLLAETHQEFQRPLYVGYVDLKSAFDSVDRSALWQALKGIGMPSILLSILQDLHTDTGARVRVGKDTSERFLTSSGVRQGCVLAPALFSRSVDWIMENTTSLAGIMVGESHFTDLDYADDIALPSSNQDDLISCLDSFATSSKTMGLNVSWAKTKVQCLGANQPLAALNVQGQVVESVDQFCYLGSVQDVSGRCHPDMMRRLGIAASSMNSLSRVWSQSKLSLSTKLRVYQTCIVPVLLYGSDTWTLLQADIHRLQAFHMRCQRRILGISWRDKITNVSITERTGLSHISAIIDTRRLALFGHVARLSDRTPAHRALSIAVDVRSGNPPSPSWKRKRGRPRASWLTPLSRQDITLQDLWDGALMRGHGFSAQRLPPDTRA